jgi:CubicO group peptidase (beta-lactamase class C family)
MLDTQRIEEQIQAYIRPDCILGMAIAIVHGESVLYRQGFGVTSIEDGGLPVTPKTIFAIGSTSKIINAMMIMRLVEQGILDLDEAVVHYLPGYVFTDNPGWGEQVTLRHLLSHTSGLACGGKAWGRVTLMHCSAGCGKRWRTLPLSLNLAVRPIMPMAHHWPAMSPKP